MALFRRKKSDSVLPEVDKYYEGERRDRPVMAWLLALVSIAVVALVIVGLFLGGRWVYDKIAGNDDSETATTSDTTETPSFDGGPDGTADEGQEGSTGTPAPAPTDQNSNQGNSGTTGSDSSSSNTPTQSQPTAQAPATTPQTGDSSLPSTGPEGIVGAFVVTSAVAGGAHYVVTRKRASRE